MADSNSNGFIGLIGGLLMAAVIVGGIFVFGAQMNHGPEINVQVPEVSTPG